MHIKPKDTGPGRGETGTGKSIGQGEPDSARKLRLGAATRIPLNTPKATNSPLRVLVSAISQSLGSKTPSKASGAKSSLSISSKASPSPSSDSHLHAPSSSAGRHQTRLGGTANLSRIPSTPTPSRLLAIAGTPARRNSVSSTSSSSSSTSYSNPLKKQNIPSTPSSTKVTVVRQLSSTTPSNKKSSVPSRTPPVLNEPRTPVSNVSRVPLPTPKRPSVSSVTSTTPVSKLTNTPYQTRSRSVHTTTPVSKPIFVEPTTPVNYENSYDTPYTKHSSHRTNTPKSTPLQARNHNVFESTRRLQFGMDAVSSVQKENVANKTPIKPFAPVEATFTFDKERLAQIKARRNSAQSLKSPAQRVRIGDYMQPSSTPSQLLQSQLSEGRSARCRNGEYAYSPSRKRIANSLFGDNIVNSSSQ